MTLLDTSFGGLGGRTYPGGSRPDATSYLGALWQGRPGWQVLAASGARRAALAGAV